MSDWTLLVRRHLSQVANHPSREADIVEELAQHLEQREADLVAGGLEPEAARAHLLGHVSDWDRLAAEIRRADRPRPRPAPPPPPVSHRVNPAATIWQDLCHAARTLARTPTFTLSVALLIALGIGASTTAFGVLKAIVLDPLPYPDAERLVAVWATPPDSRASQPLSVPEFRDWRERTRSFAELGLQTLEWTNLGGQAHPQRVRAVVCTAGFLRAFGVQPARGRLFTDEEEGRRERLLVLGDGAWRRRFGSSNQVVGQKALLNGVAFTIIGVMPPGFESPRPYFTDTGGEFWIPLDPGADAGNRSRRWLFGLGRLAPGVAMEAAEQDLVRVAASLARDHPSTNARVTAWVQPLEDRVSGDVRRPLGFLFGAVIVLLVICIVNVASLMLARASAQQPELGVRLALGATPWRLARARLTESLLVTGLGGAAGVITAWWSTAVWRRFIPATIQRTSAIDLDGGVLAFAVTATVACGVLAGLAPVLSAARGRTIAGWRTGSRAPVGRRGRARLQPLLVVAELGLLLALAQGAVVMLQSYRLVLGRPVGFDTSRVVASVSLQGPEYDARTPTAQTAFWARLLEKVGSMPGVSVAAATTKLPLNGGMNGTYLVEQERHDPTIERPLVEESYVTPEYFAAAGITVVTGRALTATDRGDTEYGVVVNGAFARRYWPAGRAVGRRVYPDTPDRAWGATIVGVVGDVHQWGLERPALPEIYFPFDIASRRTRHLVLETRLSLSALERELRDAVASIDNRQAVSGVRTLGQVVSGDTDRRRFQTVLVSVFALVALAMVLGGVHGLLSWQVTQRRREFGVRMALGADAGTLVRAVVRRGLVMAGAGALIGLGLALAAGRVLASLVFGVSPWNPAALSVVAVLMAAVGTVGAAWPAWQASRVDPVTVLRTE